MHAYESKNGTRFFFDQGVLGGDVVVNGVRFDGDDLVEFVMINYALPKKIEKLEQVDWMDL